MELPWLLLRPSSGVALVAAGLATVAGSLVYSLASAEGEWFQRSGSLLVLFAVVLEIRQTAIEQPKKSKSVSIEGTAAATRGSISVANKRLHRIAWGGIVIGTVIWGYGDLLF